MVTPDPRSGFTDIDQSTDPAGFVRVLDTLTVWTSSGPTSSAPSSCSVSSWETASSTWAAERDDVQALARLVGLSGRVVGVEERRHPDRHRYVGNGPQTPLRGTSSLVQPVHASSQ